MPYLVQKTYWGKTSDENESTIKIVQTEEDSDNSREETFELYKEEAIQIYHNYISGCHEDLQDFCDTNELEELISEILEEDCSDQLKYFLILRSIVQSFFCCVRSTEISSWNPEGKSIMDEEIIYH